MINDKDVGERRGRVCTVKGMDCRHESRYARNELVRGVVLERVMGVHRYRRAAGCFAAIAMAMFVAACSRQEGVEHPSSLAVPYAFWRVTSPTTTVYLLGSIHYGTKEMYPLPEEVESAFASSSVLVIEADPDGMSAANRRAFLEQRAFCEKGKKLDDYLSEDGRQALRAYWKDTGRSEELMDMVQRLRPWGATLILPTWLSRSADVSSELGVDKHFLKEAGGKQLVELEGLAYQMEFMASVPADEQEAELLRTLASLHDEKPGSTFAQTIAAWKSGDLPGMERLSRDWYGNSQAMNNLRDARVFQRNQKMAEKIEQLLSGQDRCFVVVGYSHLIGKRGIAEWLSSKYKVEAGMVSRLDATSKMEKAG